MQKIIREEEEVAEYHDKHQPGRNGSCAVRILFMNILSEEY